MKQLVLLSLLVIFSCKNASDNIDEKEILLDDDVVKQIDNSKIDLDLKVYDYDGLEPIINKEDDKVHVVNFWATWCAPCVKELPYFEAINENYKKDNVEVLLVSLDFPNQYESKLKPFIAKHNLKSEVVAFDDINQDRWLRAINEEWTGALPATIIYNSEKRQFYEQSFTKEELETELKQFIN